MSCGQYVVGYYLEHQGKLGFVSYFLEIGTGDYAQAQYWWKDYQWVGGFGGDVRGLVDHWWMYQGAFLRSSADVQRPLPSRYIFPCDRALPTADHRQTFPKIRLRHWKKPARVRFRNPTRIRPQKDPRHPNRPNVRHHRQTGFSARLLMVENLVTKLKFACVFQRVQSWPFGVVNATRESQTRLLSRHFGACKKF